MGQHSHLYKSARWRNKRAQQLAAQPLCQNCLRMGKVKPATVADHITPHKGNEYLFWHGALQSLCKPCHDHYKQLEEHGRYSAACDASGMPVDPNHPWNR